MDPIYPWLDPIEVRHLADQLLRPVRQPAVNVADAGFSDAFVGFGPDSAAPGGLPEIEVARAPAAAVILHTVEVPPQVSIPTEPAAVASPALSPPPLPASPPVPARGPFLDRIMQFKDWMHLHFSATGIFILDREGIVLYDDSNHGRLHFLARSLALASRRPGATAGNVHVKIGAGATLEVIPVETAFGCLVLGAVVPETLDPQGVSAVMDAMVLVASPPDPD